MIESNQWVQRYRAGRQLERPKKDGYIALVTLGNEQTPRLGGGAGEGLVFVLNKCNCC